MSFSTDFGMQIVGKPLRLNLNATLSAYNPVIELPPTMEIAASMFSVRSRSSSSSERSISSTKFSELIVRTRNGSCRGAVPRMLPPAAPAASTICGIRVISPACGYASSSSNPS